MGGGSLREQVDEKYKVGDGTPSEGARMRGEDTTDPFARSTGQVRPISIFIYILF
jgi:hypothetical protein